MPFGLARAAAPAYSGIYVVIDPYKSTDMQNLQIAASTACPAAAATNPFCGASGTQYVSGIFLQVHWCSWELANVSLNTNQHQTCYYVVNASGDAKVTALAGDMQSTCATQSQPPQFDTCSASLLFKALDLIDQINTSRTTNGGLKPLQISIGMEAGAATAMRFIYDPTKTQTTQPLTYDISSTLGGNLCLRAPNTWDPNYVLGYENALDTLITSIKSRHTSFAKSIYVVKIAPANLMTNEYDTGGDYFNTTTTADDQSLKPTNAIEIACPGLTDSPNNGAGTLANGYKAQYNAALIYTGTSPSYPDCRGYGTLAQANECVLGVVMGHIRGTLKLNQLFSAVESIPTNNGNALPDVACGVDGAGAATNKPCVVQGVRPSYAGDDWSVYYFWQEVSDLVVSNTPAQLAAKWAFTDAGAGTNLSFANLLAITWTGLTIANSGPSYNFFTDAQDTGNISIDQVACALNNTVPANDSSFTLDNNPTPVLGISTILSWQTNTMQGSQYCTVGYNQSGYTTEFGPILASGYHNGGIFLEVQTDVAFNTVTGSLPFTGYLNQCGPDLANGLNSLLAAAAAPGICLY